MREIYLPRQIIGLVPLAAFVCFIESRSVVFLNARELYISICPCTSYTLPQFEAAVYFLQPEKKVNTLNILILLI